MHKIIFLVNSNQGVIAIILFVLGVIITLIIRDRLNKKFIQRSGDNSKNYQAEHLTINNNE